MASEKVPHQHHTTAPPYEPEADAGTVPISHSQPPQYQPSPIQETRPEQPQFQQSHPPQPKFQSQYGQQPSYPPNGGHDFHPSSHGNYGINEGMAYQQNLMAQCARGNHAYDTKFGVAGIIISICCFPIGLLALCIDKKEVCTRCGHQTV